MKVTILLFVACLLTTYSSAQIKINSPYKQKDKTYIPDGDEPAPMPPDRKTPPQTRTEPASTTTYMDDEVEVNKVIRALFSAMHGVDVNAIKQLFVPEGRLITTDANGLMSTMTVNEFANMIGGSQKGSMREEVRDMEVRIDDHLASVWVEYNFFFNEKFHHCGVDAFQMHRQGTSWKITQIADTRRDDCSEDGEEVVINKVMDAWHASASSAQMQPYFDRLSDDAVFLGTDPTENWSKDEFYRFAKPFFEKGEVWDFKSTERHVSFNDEGDISWFNELLDTRMGKCRGSGVLRKTGDGKWELTQYNLAILVPNDKVSDYLKLIGQGR